MILASVLQAIGLFAATNIDDIIVLSLFFARGAGQHGTTARILAGQYLGFAGILGAAVLVTIGAGAFLPSTAIPYFGLIPLGLGLWAAWQTWRGDDDDDDDEAKVAGKKVGVGGSRRRHLCQRWRQHRRLHPCIPQRGTSRSSRLLRYLPRARCGAGGPGKVRRHPSPDRGSARTLGAHPLSHRSHRTRHRDPRQRRSLRALT
ncbi:hypothetical protein CIP107571_01040 [Corynebacterium diphtheriae]|nr:hypothetical protein CIP107571_01040 [Corynebacterium diphtheriae]